MHTGKVATMPRFYFDIHDESGIHRDEEGEMFENPQAAAVEANQIATEMVRHGIGPVSQLDRAIEVRDQSGDRLLRVRVSAKLETQGLK